MQKNENLLALPMQFFAEEAPSEPAEAAASDEDLLTDLVGGDGEEADEREIVQENFGGDEDEWIAFVREHPDVTELPESVIRRLSAGEPLRYAYAMAEIEQLRCRLAVYEQNAQAAARSTGSLLSEDAGEETDPFLEGLFA